MTKQKDSRVKLPDDSLGSVKALPNTPPPRGKAPTYKAIQAEVHATQGYTAETCWIADVLRQMGHPVREAHNRKRKQPVKACPPDKAPAIKRAIERLARP